MKIENLKLKIFYKYWPVLFIVFVWFVFSSPYFIFGKVPFPSSYLANNFGPWNTYLSQKVGYVKNDAAPDVITQIFPWKKLTIDIWKSGNVPLWNPYGFSGTPLLANYQSAVLSPFNLLYFVLPFIDAWSLLVLLQPLLAGLFTYLFARSLKLSEPASLISSLGFMFCGFITSWMVYGTLGAAILFLPLALFSIEKFYQSKKWYYAALLTASVPLSLLSGHFQMSLYFLVFVIAYLLFKAVSTKKTSLPLALSVTLGLLISAPQLLPSIELYLESARSALFAKIEVIPWSYLPTLAAPDFFGNPVTRNAWFGHYQEWNAYIGLIPLLLAFYGLTKVRAHVIFFLAASIIPIALAFQTPLLDLLISLKVPVLSTSAAARIIVLFSFSAAVLAGFGLDNLISDLSNKNFKRMVIWWTGAGVVFALLWGIILLKLLIPLDKISTSFSNFRLPTIFFVILSLTLLARLFVKDKKVLLIAPLVLVLVTGFDAYRFASKWQPFDPREYVYPQVPVAKFLSEHEGYDRAFGSFTQEAATLTGIPTVEGYDPLYIKRYAEFIEAAPDGKPRPAQRNIATLSKNGEYTNKLLDFLGVKYIVHKLADGRAVWAYPFWATPEQFKTIYLDEKYQILENLKAPPRVFLVYDYKEARGQDEIFKLIFNKATDLQKTAILEENPGITFDSDSTGSAAIIRYKPNAIVVDIDSKASALLILTDPFYPGWEALVDGAKAKIYRTDYAFRAVVVPPGTRKVEFIYNPESFRWGLVLAFSGIIGTSCFSLFLWKRRSRS